MELPYNLPGDGPVHRFEAREAQGWLPRGWIDGLILSNDETDATNDIAISAGVCRSTSNIGPDGIRTTLAKYQADLEIPVSIIKQLDVAWAPENYDPEGYSGGDRSGMRSSSSISNTTWHVYAIGGFDCPADILAHDGVADPSAVLPNGYTAWRRIGSLLRTSGALVGFVQAGDTFLRKVPIQDYAATNPGTSAVLRALSTPVGIKVGAIHSVAMDDSTTGFDNYLLLTSPDQTDAAAAADVFSLKNLNTATISGASAQFTVPTDTSAQIRTRLSSSDGSVTLTGCTHGWIDARGRDA